MKPDAIIGKIGSGFHEYGGELTIASVATISRPEHIKRLQAIGYGLIVIDEAHRSGAESYKRVLEALPDAFVLKVTATPSRLDGKPISDKPPLYSASIIDMIQQGYLCDVKAIAIRTETNLDDIKSQAGDFKVDELEEAVDTPYRNNRVVEAFQEHASDRRAICFGVTVQHAQNLAACFQQRSIPSACVSGETPLAERNRLYAALRTGEIKVLTNVNVLTEGFDLPLVDCVIMARPTQSRTLYIQSIGRGLRLAPIKKDCIILDLTDNCLKHRLEPQNLRSALNKNIKNDELVTEALAREEQEFNERKAIVRKLPETRNKDLTVNLLEKLTWTEGTNGMYIMQIGRERHRIALVPSSSMDGYYSVWARLSPDFKAQKWMNDAPLDWAQQFSEREARKLISDPKNSILVDRNASWRSQPASEAQLEKLEKYQKRFHLNYDPATISRGQAADLLDPIFEQFRQWREAKERQQVTV